MRYIVLLLLPLSVHAQNLQVVYPPVIYFEYWNPGDSTHRGPFLMKLEADLSSPKDNIGKSYVQFSQAIRFWKPKVYLAVQYSGGLGTNYSIANAYSIGVSVPFSGYNLLVLYTYNAFPRPSQDPLVSFYWWKGLHHYKWELSGDINGYTLNKNPHGKWLCFFGEPQLWYNVCKHLSLGARVNLYYNDLALDNCFQWGPTIGLKYKL